MTYTVEPTDHWRAGDRAYCVHGVKSAGRPILEAGRLYTVVEAQQIEGLMNDGLRLAEVSPPSGMWGFSSHHFACIRSPARPAQQIVQRCRRGWLEAYEECRDARAAQGIVTREGGDALAAPASKAR